MRIATDTAGTPSQSVLFMAKTSGSKSKPTRPRSKPADSPKIRWNLSDERSATKPPRVVARTVIAANVMAIFMSQS
jgi:hypothetical protein